MGFSLMMRRSCGCGSVLKNICPCSLSSNRAHTQREGLDQIGNKTMHIIICTLSFLLSLRFVIFHPSSPPSVRHIRSYSSLLHVHVHASPASYLLQTCEYYVMCTFTFYRAAEQTPFVFHIKILNIEFQSIFQQYHFP